MPNIKVLKEQRKKLGMTFDELSEKSSIPKRTLENIFLGKTKNPRVDTMQAIEEALGLSSPPLEWSEEEKALGVGRHPTYLSEKEWRRLDAFNELERVKGEAFAEKMLIMIEEIAKTPDKK